MLVVLPFHTADADRLSELLGWIAQLGACRGHEALLVADAGVAWPTAKAVLDQASLLFDKATIITNEKHVSGWSRGANSLWMTAAKTVKEPWLWLESDAVPLRPGWLDIISGAYGLCGKPFMGVVMENTDPRFPARYLAGNAVYPANAHEIIGPFIWEDGKTWDTCDAAEQVVPLTAHINLIQNIWGEPDNPPTFAEESVPRTNVFSLKSLRPDAVIFHRNKDGALIRLLRRKLFPQATTLPIAVVFPVCAMDVQLAIAHAQWLKRLNRVWHHPAVIAYDRGLSAGLRGHLRNLLADCFPSVEILSVPTPRIPGWPHAPNWMWQHVARHMAGQKNPWLWLEADAVVLKPDWLDRIQDEYDKAGKAWMGPIVPDLGHCNGVAVYPADAATRLPHAMKCTDRAWDYEMKPEMIRDCHDASKLIFHAWGVHNGRIHPHTGSAPDFSDESICRQIPSDAVVVHRSKTTALINWITRNKL